MNDHNHDGTKERLGAGNGPREVDVPLDLETDAGLDAAIAVWKAAVPRVSLTDRTLAAWRGESELVQTALQSVEKSKDKTSGASRSGRGTWILRAVAAAALVLLGLSLWTGRNPDPQVANRENGGTRADLEREWPVKPDGIASKETNVVSPPLVATDSGTVEDESVVTELVVDAKAAVQDLTSNAAAGVTELFAVAWPSPKPAAVPTSEAAGRTWLEPSRQLDPIQEGIRPMTAPVGAAVDYLLERLGGNERGAS